MKSREMPSVFEQPVSSKALGMEEVGIEGRE